MRVLVVDDSRAMRMIVVRALRQSGLPIAEVREGADGVEALAIIADFDPELVLCDWNMPNMSGIELLVALREGGDHRPFGFVTWESSPGTREKGIAAGATFLITKPFSGERLADMITSLVAS